MTSTADNKGISFAVAKLYTSSSPGISVIKFIARKSSASRTEPVIRWERLELTEWADILSKGYKGGPREAERRRLFSDALRVRVDWKELDWITEDVTRFERP